MKNLTALNRIQLIVDFYMIEKFIKGLTLAGIKMCSRHHCQIICNFYPTALKACQGTVFTHGVRIGGRREKIVWAVSQKL